MISREKICFVAVPVAEFGPLSPIPARYPAEILGDPGQPVDLVRPTIQASLQKTPGGGIAAGAEGEFGRKADLVVRRLPEYRRTALR